MMRVYTCCPHDCGAHGETLRFLNDWGIEPSLGLDEEAGAHYLEFTPPRGLYKKKRFINALCLKTTGMPLRYCGRCFSAHKSQRAWNVGCNRCGQEFAICEGCLKNHKAECPHYEHQKAAQ